MGFKMCIRDRAYAGHWISSAGGALQTSEKSVEQLLPVVGYVDEEGNVIDTFFQSVTFLSHGYTPNLDTPDDPSDYHRLIYSSAEMTGNPQAAELAANKQDWQTWLDFLFDFDDGKGGVYNLDALEQAVEMCIRDRCASARDAFSDSWNRLPCLGCRNRKQQKLSVASCTIASFISPRT